MNPYGMKPPSDELAELALSVFAKFGEMILAQDEGDHERAEEISEEIDQLDAELTAFMSPKEGGNQ